MLKLCVVVLLLIVIYTCYTREILLQTSDNSETRNYDQLRSYLQLVILDLLKQNPQTTDLVTVNLGQSKASSMIRSIVRNVSTKVNIAKSEDAIGFNVKRSSIFLLDGTYPLSLSKYLIKFIGTTDEDESYFQYVIHRPLQYFIIVSDQQRLEYFNSLHKLGIINCLYVRPINKPPGFGVWITNLAYTQFYPLEPPPWAPFGHLEHPWRGASYKVVLVGSPPYLVLSQSDTKSFDLDLLREIEPRTGVNFTQRRLLANIKELMDEKLQDELDIPYSHFMTRYVRVFHPSRWITLPEESNWCIVINFEPSWVFTGILHNPFEYDTWIPVLTATAIIVLFIKRFEITYHFLILLVLSILYLATSISHLLVAKFNPGPQTLDEFFKSDIDLYIHSSGSIVEIVKFMPEIQLRLQTYEAFSNGSNQYAELMPCSEAHWKLRQSSNSDPKFYILRHSMNFVMEAFSAIRTFIFQAKLQQCIWELFEAGIYQKLSEYYSETLSGGIMIRLRTDPVLHLEDVKYFWIFLAGGWFLGCLIFALEFTEWKTNPWSGWITQLKPIEASQKEEAEVIEVTELM